MGLLHHNQYGASASSLSSSSSVITIVITTTDQNGEALKMTSSSLMLITDSAHVVLGSSRIVISLTSRIHRNGRLCHHRYDADLNHHQPYQHTVVFIKCLSFLCLCFCLLSAAVSALRAPLHRLHAHQQHHHSAIMTALLVVFIVTMIIFIVIFIVIIIIVMVVVPFTRGQTQKYC